MVIDRREREGGARGGSVKIRVKAKAQKKIRT